jgi:hypothetical protein
MSLLVVGLPVGEPDPARRLELVHRATTAAKARLRAPGGDVTGLRLPGPLTRWVLLAGRRFGTRRVTLSVTDVPGPTAPLGLAGARLLEAVPVPPLVQGVPLSVAALSYAGDLCVSVHADGALDELHLLAEGVARSLAAATALAAAGSTTQPHPSSAAP